MSVTQPYTLDTIREDSPAFFARQRALIAEVTTLVRSREPDPAEKDDSDAQQTTS